jgi:hypothetical protein
MDNFEEASMKKLAILVTIGVFGANLLYGHHGWTGYDESKTLKITGVIKAAGYANPHPFVKLEADKKIWNVVLPPLILLQARGLEKDKLKAGTTATVVGYPHRQIADELRAERITIGGKTIELR